MTQEEKQLLFIDICARLPYGVMIKDTYSGHYGKLMEIGNTFAYFVSELNSNTLDVQLCHVKPYLRPMPSMIEGEREDFTHIGGPIIYDENSNLIIGFENNTFEQFVLLENWLNAHHFDYRGLIDKGLALEAKEGMYKNKNE